MNVLIQNRKKINVRAFVPGSVLGCWTETQKNTESIPFATEIFYVTKFSKVSFGLSQVPNTSSLVCQSSTRLLHLNGNT